VSTWTGAISGLWSDPGNWDVAPTAGSDLVFPAGASNTTTTDDLGDGVGFGSLTISGSGYTIAGDAVSLSGTIDASQASGGATVNLPIALGGTATVQVDHSGASLVLGGVITGSSGLTKQGAGQLVLSAANTYTGTTTVVAGVLRVDGSQGGSPVAVDAGATLEGTGTVGSITSTSGTVSPGDGAPGVLTDVGDLTLDSGSTFAAALNGDAAGTGYGQVQVAGQVNLGGATLNATLGFTPTGHDQFMLIDNTGSSAVSGTFAGLTQGAPVTISGQTFLISYTGGDGNDVVLTHLVASSTSVSASPSSSVFGQAVTLTATVTGSDSGTPTGMVQFFSGTTSLGTAPLSGGTASMTTSALAVGTDAITATYLGDANYATSTSTATNVAVDKASTTTALSASSSSAVFGQAVILTATVTATSPGSGTPTGSVQFFSGSTLLGTANLSGGTATLSVTSLPLGGNAITAVYGADTNFLASTSTGVAVTVAQASTTTTVTASPSSPVVGQSVTLTATVAASGSGGGTPTGSVQFFNGTTSLGTATLSGGVASLTTSALGVGTDSITAVYSGDADFLTSTSAATNVTVAQASTTTTVTASTSSSVFGQSVTLTATVAASGSGGGTPTGTVQFFSGSTSLGTATLSGGTATLTTSALPAGSDSITAVYQGDSNFATSTSAAVTVAVSQGTTSTVLTASTTTPTKGESVTLTATVTASTGSGTPTGTVEFFSGTTSLGTATLSNGTASLTVTSLAAGTDSVTAVYQGDTNFAGSTSASQAITVSSASGAMTANEQYVTQVFLAVLGRSPQASGLAYWSNLLAEGVSRRMVARLIVNSREAQLVAANTAFQAYLGRSASLDEATSTVAQAKASHVSVNAVVLGSQEFFDNEGGGTNSGYLTALSQAVTGADLSATEQATLSGQLDNGVSRVTVAQEVLQSQAGKTAQVQALYQQVLGRDPDSAELARAVSLLNRGITIRQEMVALLSSAEFLSLATSGG
jgi:trimeric autotransporter adhesin